MPATASLEDLKPAQNPLRYALCLPAGRQALCPMLFSEMASNWVEECLQAVVTGKHARTIEK
jgi:hypothetical protein